MRALKAATIIMGVLILIGTAVVIATIFKRATAPTPAISARPPFLLRLEEPPGTRIAGATAMGSLLALRLTGGGPDRIMLVDPQSGRLSGRVTLTNP